MLVDSSVELGNADVSIVVSAMDDDNVLGIEVTVSVEPKSVVLSVVPSTVEVAPLLFQL